MSKAGGTAFRRGDLVMFVSYIPDGAGYNANGMDSKEPCLCITTHERKSGDRKLWVIPLSTAWRYCNSDGYPTSWCYQRTADIGNMIGLGDGVQARRQIFQMIGDYLPMVLEAFEYEMVKDDRHPDIPVDGEVKVYQGGTLAAGGLMHAF
ncbi:MAG: hypothetical protein K2Y51_26050 [Gammaproteobacteria bacterium]|nr:hypothetical protein [Gammaproteobacteria bacterium]